MVTTSGVTSIAMMIANIQVDGFSRLMNPNINLFFLTIIF
jgi:hypothetical protein